MLKISTASAGADKVRVVSPHIIAQIVKIVKTHMRE